MTDELIDLVSGLLGGTAAHKGVSAKRLDVAKIDVGQLRDAVELVTPAKRITDAFKEWAARNEFDGASIAVLRRGKVVGYAAFGSESATARNEFASCSKLITGLCIAQLVRQGKLHFDTKMEDIFGSIFKVNQRRLQQLVEVREPRIIDVVSKLPVIDEKRAGSQKVYAFANPAPHGAMRAKLVTIPVFVTFPDWFRSLTVTEVMTHMSGIRGQADEGNPYYITLDDRFEMIVTATNQGPKTFSYQNNNYGLLGKIVEVVTGKSFEAACKELVLGPLGITDFAADNRGPYAGCFLSTVHYATMMSYLDRDLNLMPDHGPDTWPRVGAYSIGTYINDSAGTYQSEHNGVWNWHDGTIATSVGAYQHYWHDIRTGYFLHFTPSYEMPYGDLHDEIDKIAHDSADAWPAFLDLVGKLGVLVKKPA